MVFFFLPRGGGWNPRIPPLNRNWMLQKCAIESKLSTLGKGGGVGNHYFVCFFSFHIICMNLHYEGIQNVCKSVQGFVLKYNCTIQHYIKV